MSETPTDPESHNPSAADRPEIAQQIEDALRQGSRQIRFDTIDKHFRGKRVWVLDREKMQVGIMRVVDQAILKSQQEAEGALKTRQRVAAAIAKLLGNKRNLTSPIDPGQAARPRPPAERDTTPADTRLEDQIARLASLINRAERVLAAAPAPSAHASTQRGPIPVSRRPAHDTVLMKILEDNLNLIRQIREQPSN